MTTRNNYLMRIGIAAILSILFIFMLMATASASETNLGENEPYQVETFELTTPGTLDVQTSGGHITVESNSTNSVRVEMYVRKNGRNLLPEDISLENWDITISQSGSSVEAIAKRLNKNRSFWNNNNNLSISFVVYTPREMSTNLKTSGGHVKARGLSGNQKIATSGGHLELTNLKGTVKARTSGGHIEIADSQGDITSRTSGGHIDVRNTEGNLEVKTSGGHIDLTDIGGTVRASTSGGNISAALNSIGEFIDLRTSGGNVNISVPIKSGFDLNLRGSYVSTNLENFSGKVDRNEVKGELNGGGPMISARTSGGRISLSFQ